MFIKPLRSIIRFRCHHCGGWCSPCHILVAVTTATLSARHHFCSPACLRGWSGPG